MRLVRLLPQDNSIPPDICLQFCLLDRHSHQLKKRERESDIIVQWVVWSSTHIKVELWELLTGVIAEVHGLSF